MIIVIYFVICKQTRIGNPVDTIPTTGAEKIEDYEEKEDQEGSGPSINYKGKAFGWSGGDDPPQPLRSPTSGRHDTSRLSTHNPSHINLKTDRQGI